MAEYADRLARLRAVGGTDLAHRPFAASRRGFAGLFFVVSPTTAILVWLTLGERLGPVVSLGMSLAAMELSLVQFQTWKRRTSP